MHPCNPQNALQSLRRILRFVTKPLARSDGLLVRLRGAGKIAPGGPQNLQALPRHGFGRRRRALLQQTESQAHVQLRVVPMLRGHFDRSQGDVLRAKCDRVRRGRIQ